VQPFITEYLTGRVAAVHNGSITNAKALRKHLKSLGLKFDATCDGEVVSSLIAYCITQTGDLIDGVVAAAKQLEGAFSLIVLSGDGRIAAVRDGHGFRPLCIGQNGAGLAIASESCALESCGFHLLRDIAPGEVIVLENTRVTHSMISLEKKLPAGGLCIFEYVYFARPDSVVDGLSVYSARRNMGLRLAEEHPVEADLVCGVPDTGLEAAAGYSAGSGIPLVGGIIRNRYVGRTFIYPTQAQRDNTLRLKLNPVSACVRGKRVILIDDSIVRGGTTECIVRSFKAAGAREVHIRISSPPIRYTCHYGTDIASEENLIANLMDVEGIRAKIGADSLGFISIDGLTSACNGCGLGFCTQCFDSA
jgi:amidophosphoribosyltransferase